jgi:hypothetical protein
MTGDWTKRSRNQQATVMVSTEVFTEISGTVSQVNPCPASQ